MLFIIFSRRTGDGRTRACRFRDKRRALARSLPAKRSIDRFVISKTPREQILPPSQDTWTDRNFDPLSKEGTSVNGLTSANLLQRAGDARMGLTNLSCFGGLGGFRFRNTHSPPDTPDRGRLAIGVSRHSDKHAPRDFPEPQGAFKVLMIYWILQAARRIAFRCVLHRSGSQDIRR